MGTTAEAPPRLALACGGTGGHFYPGLAIAREYRRQGGEVLLCIGGHHREEQVRIAGEEGFAAAPLGAQRLPANKLALPLFAGRTAGNVGASWALLGREGIGAALVMGSFAALPLGLAAGLRRLPLYVHEGNAMLGRANQLLSRFARRSFLAFPNQGRPAFGRAEVVGMPVRERILQAAEAPPSPGELRAELGLAADRPTLLVFGGSQGATRLNAAVRDALLDFADRQALQLIHLSGSEDPEPLQFVYREAGVDACVMARSEAMERCILAADLVVCRAGGSTIAELALLGRPALLVHLPEAMDDHQTANARTVADAGGGVLLPQAQCTPERLREQLADWLRRSAYYAAMGRAVRRLARPGAAAAVAAAIRAG